MLSLFLTHVPHVSKAKQPARVPIPRNYPRSLFWQLIPVDAQLPVGTPTQVQAIVVPHLVTTGSRLQ